MKVVQKCTLHFAVALCVFACTCQAIIVVSAASHLQISHPEGSLSNFELSQI